MRFCNENCNECGLLYNKQLTKILNMIYLYFGDDAYRIVQSQCPNLTCCADCRIDEFCHTEECEISEDAEKELTKLMGVVK